MPILSTRAISQWCILGARPVRVLTIGSLCLLCACAADETWRKPDIDAATMERDLDACRHEAMRAEVATSGALDEPLGSGPQSLPRVTSLGGYPDGAGLSDSDAHAILRQCLEARGYRPDAPR
jgi:hypothetical protein